MSKQIQQGTITFQNYKNAQDGILQFTAGAMVSGAEGPDLEFGGIVNAVDIDWNGAQVANNTVLNTTGDLINAIKWASTVGGAATDTKNTAGSTNDTSIIYIRFFFDLKCLNLQAKYEENRTDRGNNKSLEIQG